MASYKIKGNTTIERNLVAERTIPSIANTLPTWVTLTSYIVGDYVEQSNKIYKCLVGHTSGTFATDLNSGNWVALSEKLPQRINTTSTLSPGIYDIDSSTASFNITLTDEIGEWFFTNTNFSLDTNAVTLLSVGN